MDITQFLGRVNAAIVNPTILLMFAIATTVFVWGLVQFIATSETDEGREKGKRKILWGLIGIFIMISAFGIIRIVLQTFGIPVDGIYGF